MSISGGVGNLLWSSPPILFVNQFARHPLSKPTSEVGPDRGASSALQQVHVGVFNFWHSPSNLSAARGFGPELSLISALHRGPGYHQWVKCDARACVLTFQMLDVYKWAVASPHRVAFLIPQSFRYLCRRPVRFTHDLFTWDVFILIYYVFGWRAARAGATQ